MGPSVRCVKHRSLRGLLSRAIRPSLAALAWGCTIEAVDPDAGVWEAPPPDAGGPPRALFVLPRASADDTGFFDLPWPTDVRRTAAGTVDVRGFPNPTRNELLQRYIDAVGAELRGWGTQGAIYFRFEAPVDPASLPADARASLEPGASVQLVDVDPESPERGRRHPIVVSFRAEPTRFWPAHTLAVRPVLGMPLRGGRRYAAVVTRAVRPASGGTFERSADFDALLAGNDADPAVHAARAMHAEAIDALEDAGIPRDQLLSIAVFKTQDPLTELDAVRDWLVVNVEAPRAHVGAWRAREANAQFEVLEGRYGPHPVFQHGDPPYTTPGSGAFRFDAGVPMLAAETTLRFALSIPTTPMPDSGYPIVLYAHGTGGDYRSFVADGTAAQLASVGLAVLGIDQVLHGERNPGGVSPEVAFFNFVNPHAARDNARQAGVDLLQLARLVETLEVPARIAARDGRPIRFDAGRVFAFGHSQGGLNVPLALAVDDRIGAAVLSGAAGTLAVALLEKTQPLDVRGVVQAVLGLPGSSPQAAFEREHFVLEHPVITLLQTWIEAADPVNYAARVHREPRAGFTPRSVLQTEGLLDEYATPNGVESLAAAMGNPIVEPLVRPVLALELQGLAPIAPPVHANVARGRATAGLIQLPADGHFAAFRNEPLRGQIRGFFASLLAGAPEIPPPTPSR
ncbi:MAG: hypothetical protein NZ898_16250 [Myxococcota bacterium]|nr:hypothetical protein [Myxococcota bacterium]MDW8362222.1 hypothetical protein [Myxococcales bacterium]